MEKKTRRTDRNRRQGRTDNDRKGRVEKSICISTYKAIEGINNLQG